MSEVFKAFQPRKFTLEEAHELLPILRRITKEVSHEFMLLEQRLKLYGSDPVKYKEIETEVNMVLGRWSSKVSKLGAVPKGIWLVDFDNGEGFYCWRYNEEEISYCHGYEEGLEERIPIEQKEPL